MAKTSAEIIIPVYNPPKEWGESCLGHMYALRSLYPDYLFHFTLVNDGCHKKAFRSFQHTMKKTNIPHTFCYLECNQGKGKALRTGLMRTNNSTSYYICVDWDFPFGIHIIGNILQKLSKGADVVVADRGDEYLHHLPFIRAVVTRCWRLFFNLVFKLHLGDTQAGIRGFNAKGKECFLASQVDSFMQDLEFLILCREHHLNIASVEAVLRGGVVLKGFSFATYLRELRMLFYIMEHYYLAPLWSHHRHI